MCLDRAALWLCRLIRIQSAAATYSRSKLHHRQSENSRIFYARGQAQSGHAIRCFQMPLSARQARRSSVIFPELLRRGERFHNLRRSRAKICCLGISLYWSTFRHHIEEQAAVPFRFLKTFTGVVRENNSDSPERWFYFAAPKITNCEPYGLPLERKAREVGLVRVASVGRGEIMAIDAHEFFDFGCKAFAADPWLAAKGPPAPPDVIFRDEPQYWQRCA